MAEQDRRTINELIALYDLEPALCDIFVEGRSDKLLMEWFLGENGLHRVRVCEIQTVEIPNALISENLEINNRGRVITLAHEVAKSLKTNNTQITCIADRDFDLVKGMNYNCPFLFFTDYSCMEMYCYNIRTLNKFLKIGLRWKKHTAEEIIDVLKDTLEKLFLIRFANSSLKLCLEPLDVGRCCKLDNGRIEFNFNDYIERYLSKNNKKYLMEKFINEINKFRMNKKPDVRHQVQGHDFAELLTWLLKACSNGNLNPDPDHVSGSLFCCLENKYVLTEKLFYSLRRRLS